MRPRALRPDERALLGVQLRDPELSGRALFALGDRLRRVTAALGASLIVNDRLDLARALPADGIHLGRRSVAIGDARAVCGDGIWISDVVPRARRGRRAYDAGADAAVLSPIFASPGKPPPLGLAGLEAARALLSESGKARRPFALDRPRRGRRGAVRSLSRRGRRRRGGGPRRPRFRRSALSLAR